MTGFFRWVRLIVLFYLLVVALVTVFQRRLIYFPTRASEHEVRSVANAAGLQPWKTRDGRIIGFYASPPEPRGAPVLVMHGNAGLAAHRGYYARLFPERAVYILEYPGFGGRAGRPKESTIRVAAAEALRELSDPPAMSREDGAPHRPVLLLGESIGSGPASWLAGTYPDVVEGVILITPFTSLVDVAGAQYRFLPVRLLLRDRWNNVGHLQGYPGPVAIVAAEDDTIVPARFARALQEELSRTSRLWVVPGAGHNTIIGDLTQDLWRSVLQFVRHRPKEELQD